MYNINLIWVSIFHCRLIYLWLCCRIVNSFCLEHQQFLEIFFFIFLTFVSRLLIPSMFCFTFLSILLDSCYSSCILMCVATFTHFCCSPKSSCNNCPFVDFINKVKIKMLNIPSFVELQIRFCKYFIYEEKIICTILFLVHIYKKIKPLHALGS